MILQSARRTTPFFRAAFLLFCGLHVALLASTRLYPFLDLPYHLAEASIVRHFGEAGNQFAHFFDPVLFPRPNVAHLLFCANGLFPSVEAANTVFLCLYSVLLPWSVLFLIRKLGGSPWFSLLAFPLLYNYDLHWGFVNYALGIPYLFFFLGAVIEDLEKGSPRTRLRLALLILVSFFIHAQMVLYSLLILFTTALFFFWRTPRQFLGRALAGLPALVPLFLWWSSVGSDWRGSSTGESLLGYYLHRFLPSLPQRVQLLALDNQHLFDGGWGLFWGFFFALAALFPLLWGLRFARRRFREVLSGKAGAAVGLFCGVTFLAMVLLPHRLSGQAHICERFAVFFLLSALVLGSALRQVQLPRAATALLILVPLLHFGLYFDYFRSFDRENADFTAGFLPDPGPEGGRTLAGLIYASKFRGSDLYVHFPSYYTVWKSGVATVRFLEYRFHLIGRRAGEDELPPYDEWIGNRGEYKGAYRHMDYLLVRGETPEATKPLLARRSLLREAGPWTILGRAR